MRIIELKINDSDLAGLDAVALVENPAIQLDFKTFSKVSIEEEIDDIDEEDILEMILEELIYEELGINTAGLPNYVNEASVGKKNKFSAELEEKQMLIGPLMTPGKLIDRLDDETGEPYQVFFSKDTIKQIAYKAMEDKLIDKVNIEHDSDKMINDVYLVESWIVEDPEHDKSTLYGFSPVEGQWMGMYKVNNDTVWQDYIKTGKVRGFSVEGFFIDNILTPK